MEQEKKAKQDGFQKCFYTPVSFVLFLVALTFPCDPTVENIAVINLWLTVLYDILPLKNVLIPEYLKTLHFSAENNPLKTRSDIVTFVFAMHRLILGEDLNVRDTLLFFEKMRANDCASKNKQSHEASCTRTSQRIPSVCVVFISREPTKQGFLMDPSVFREDVVNTKRNDDEVWQDAMQNANAFCSCVFSAKWFFLHMVATGFPNIPTASDKYKFHTFLTLFGKLLACFACRVNFQANMDLVQYNTSTDLLSKETVCAILFKLHNAVNAMLSKPNNTTTLEETCKFFQTLLTASLDEHMCSIIITKENTALPRFYFSK